MVQRYRLLSRKGADVLQRDALYVHFSSRTVLVLVLSKVISSQLINRLLPSGKTRLHCSSV